MTAVRVRGAAMTAQGRLDQDVDELARQAAAAALEDAGLDGSAVGAVLFSNSMGAALEDQPMVRGQAWLRGLPLHGAPVFNVENACAGGAAAVSLATSLARGGAGPVLVVGAEKMWKGDRSATMRGIEGGFAADLREDQRRRYANDAGSIAMGMNATWARHQVAERGATVEQFAAAAALAYRHGAANPLAQRRQRHDVDEILASPVVASPLTRLMCSSFTDGAAALVVDADDDARHPEILASVVVSGDGSGEYHQRVAESAASAWEHAGVGPGDVDVVELHDPSGAEVLWALEAMGLHAVGESGPAILAGDAGIGGAGPVVNPSGGLVARGHPIGATGLCQVAELVAQLRGAAGERQVDGARLGVASNTGGVIGDDTAVAVTTVLRAG